MHDLPTASAINDLVGTPTRDGFEALAAKARRAVDAFYTTTLPARSIVDRLFTEPYESPSARLARLVAEHQDPIERLAESVERMVGGRTELERLLARESATAR